MKDYKKLKRIFADDPEMLRQLAHEEMMSKIDAKSAQEIKAEYIKGEKGDIGEIGPEPSNEKLLGLIEPLIPEPIPGKDGKDGLDGKNGRDGIDADENGIIHKVLAKVPSQKELEPLDIVEKLNTLTEKINATVIKDLPTLEDFLKRIKGNRLLEFKDIKGAPLDQRWHGGGLSNITGLIEAGTNISLTGLGTTSSPYIINSTGSSSPLTTKGDLYTYSTLDTRLPVGSNGQVLSADSSEVTGLKWVPNSGTPGGSDTSIQWNNGGAFDGFGSWDGTTFTIDGGFIASQNSIITSSNKLYFGDTAQVYITSSDADSVLELSALDHIYLHNKVGIMTNSPRGDLDVNNPVAQVTGAMVVATSDASGDFDDSNFFSFSFEVYAYKNGVDIGPVSASGAPIQYDENDTIGQYYLTLSWDAVAGVDGYKLVILTDDYDSYYGDYYVDVGNVTSVDYGLSGQVQGSAVFQSPMLLPSGSDFYIDTSTGELIQAKDMSIGGISTFTGASTFTGGINGSLNVFVSDGTNAIPALRLSNNAGSGHGAMLEWYSGYGSKVTGQTYSNASGANGADWHLYLLDQTTGTLTERMYIDNAGKVGIGNASPSQKLDVTGEIRGTGYRSSDNSAGISTTITTASLVGKTITIKNGLITGFA